MRKKYSSNNVLKTSLLALILTVGTDVEAGAESLYKCKNNPYLQYFDDTIYRVADRFFGLGRSFEVLIDQNFEPICNEENIRYMVNDGRDNKINIVWAEDFVTSYTDAGVSCRFRVGVKHKYFFATDWTFALDTIRLEKTIAHSPYKYEDATPVGNKVYPFSERSDCKKIN